MTGTLRFETTGHLGRQARNLVVSSLLCALGACGGLPGLDTPAPPVGPPFLVGGPVSGLRGTDLEVSNLADSTSSNIVIVAGSASFNLPPVFNPGDGYDLIIAHQPAQPAQFCVIKNGQGVVGSADVLNVSISCSNVASRFLFVGGSNGVASYGIDESTGRLTSNASLALTAGPHYVGVDPYNKFLFVADAAANQILGFAINSTSGSLNVLPTSPYAVGARPDFLGFRVRPSIGVNLYAANQLDDTLSDLAIDQASGALTPESGSPFAAGSQPVSIAATLNPAFLVLDGGANSIYAFGLSGATAFALPGSPYATGKLPVAQVLDSSGRFLYVANRGDDTVSGFRVAYDGSLTSMSASPFFTGHLPAAIAIDPYSRFAYVINAGDSTISAYRIDSASGNLVAIPGSPFGAGGSPMAAQIDSLGKFLWVSYGATNGISGFSVDQISGALAPIAGSTVPTVSAPASLALGN